jgi:hypothetical protein
MKDAYYFSHDFNARNDQKIVGMRTEYGMEGYGMYFMLLEIMGESSNYRIDLNAKFSYNALAAQLMVDVLNLKTFIDDCVSEFELFYVEDGFLCSTSFLNRMKLKNEKSEKARESALKRWGKTESATDETECEHSNEKTQPQCERNALKESKVNKTNQIKEKKETPIPIARQMTPEYKLFEELNAIIHNGESIFTNEIFNNLRGIMSHPKIGAAGCLKAANKFMGPLGEWDREQGHGYDYLFKSVERVSDWMIKVNGKKPDNSKHELVKRRKEMLNANVSME